VRQSAENRLKKKGLYFSILVPSFLSDLSTAFTLLKCEIISWDWYYYICKDKNGNDQGMMKTEMKVNQVYVAFLVTNPINIRSKVNENEPNKVKGAGTCLLLKAEEIALNEGKDSVSLYPLPTAVSFYEKNGFAKTNGGKMSKKVYQASSFGIGSLIPSFFIQERIEYFIYTVRRTIDQGLKSLGTSLLSLFRFV
jgi:hypothetical protein